MARLFAGQRVRIVCPESNCNGQECWIREVGVVGWIDDETSFIGCSVDLPSTSIESDWCVFENHELEPILPEGAQPLGYSFELMMSEFGVTEAVK